ncbi:MAG: DNA-binding response regulator [Candidatus Schekmanbacteria bacterium RIFCSPLOWO2_02_FULL_38_14]|uniref:DNA-binding response regulator n=1 Tax=Candidatus Schekmanbacteria bacterium RIFCSPLOWO2_12_FULL_38_15 TaxID=1817883 RepID=A0A1F7SJ99_9BACT|nr:MAG: DNA-binding response regulator [Candidatus Schekmanbacteria bacterium RIFCSPLOWO2_02_FULL_38_14]OGL53294.1 MAG: DNA-binding response regulator [Candidatus Schekmanbacteria bacterium RIFCSPLOWO2_12_FULL_38_15]
MANIKVLIIDDDKKLVGMIKNYLEKDGYEIIAAFDGAEGIEKTESHRPDLVILDLMLPKLDGLEVCKLIRKESSMPILMLSAKGEEADIVVGLELGADDYLSKPFSLRELSARVKAILRRVSKLKEDEKSKKKILKYKILQIDFQKHEVTINGEKTELTATEFALLEMLATNPGRVFTRDQLLDGVRGRELTPFDRSIDIHISHLRQKIEPDPKEPTYIKTVWGVGYKFEDEE